MVLAHYRVKERYTVRFKDETRPTRRMGSICLGWCRPVETHSANDAFLLTNGKRRNRGISGSQASDFPVEEKNLQ